ncbi:hypothetical protein DRP53_00710 [candidate division WOR-3 bacterium]|uniref:DUF5050 domain-containing protein n=1 Tax=candidate division WOR-3 bacterium TaxID=2052148 RepID=A0A660SNK9_UNCW3|nr:MAG: hypothetical protein DRP53_00710 [candidate division WOR-3 bacterium]
MSRYLRVALIFSILLACKKKTSVEKASELIEKGKFQEAVKTITRALRSDSLNPDLYYRLCQAYIGLDSLLGASRAYLKLYELDSLKAESEEIKVNLAELCGLEPYRIVRLTRTRSNEYSPYPAKSGVYFASDRYRRSDIYLLKGRKSRRVIRGGGWKSNPVPVKEGICFSAGFDREEEIYCYSFKNRKIRRLTNNDEGDYPTGSDREGLRLLYCSHIDGDWDIHLMDLETGETRPITRNDYLDGDASFTPDGKRIIYVSKIKGAERIVIADLKGKVKKVLPMVDVRHPCFVDSYRIVYQGRGGRDWDLYLYDLKKDRVLTLTRNRREDYHPKADIREGKIYFVSKIRRQWDIFMVDLKRPIETKKLIGYLSRLTKEKKKIS